MIRLGDHLSGDARRAYLRQADFEAGRVRILLAEFGLTDLTAELLGEQRRVSGERRLTFASLHRLLPGFPVLLEARAVGRLAERCPPAALFRSFGQLFLLERYLETYARHEEGARGRPVGLVVPFDGFRGGVVLHNGTFDTRGTKMVHDVADDLPPHRVTVEPFIPFVRHLARGGWKPRTPGPDRASAQGPKVRRPVPLRPWMVRVLGTGPGLILLAWLWGVLRARSAYRRRLVARLADGRRAVAATHAQIAVETGLNAYQVKRGLAELRRRGLVATQALRGRSYLVPDGEAVRLARAGARA